MTRLRGKPGCVRATGQVKSQNTVHERRATLRWTGGSCEIGNILYQLSEVGAGDLLPSTTTDAPLRRQYV